MPDQPPLPLTPSEPCQRCRGAEDVYYLPGRADVVGGKRIVCPECNGTRQVGALEQDCG